MKTCASPSQVTLEVITNIASPMSNSSSNLNQSTLPSPTPITINNIPCATITVSPRNSSPIVQSTLSSSIPHHTQPILGRSDQDKPVESSILDQGLVVKTYSNRSARKRPYTVSNGSTNQSEHGLNTSHIIQTDPLKVNSESRLQPPDDPEETENNYQNYLNESHGVTSYNSEEDTIPWVNSVIRQNYQSFGYESNFIRNDLIPMETTDYHNSNFDQEEDDEDDEDEDHSENKYIYKMNTSNTNNPIATHFHDQQPAHHHNHNNNNNNNHNHHQNNHHPNHHQHHQHHNQLNQLTNVSPLGQTSSSSSVQSTPLTESNPTTTTSPGLFCPIEHNYIPTSTINSFSHETNQLYPISSKKKVNFESPITNEQLTNDQYSLTIPTNTFENLVHNHHSVQLHHHGQIHHQW
ncbi:myb-like protein A [Panonychus citri]|uniref:myb-like protein A n=1 Tax=Panonychus citri TaxID=50023 RepID=UPI002307018B|nr:myb-like protein A [Panonychus citri]